MLLVRLFGKIVRGEKIVCADVFDAPTEGILSESRIILAALSLFVVWVSPDLLAPPGTAAFGVLVAYMGFAVAVPAVRVWRFPGRAAGYAVHVLDIAFLFALSALTGWRAGPFYPFFIFFILFAASLRWNWQAVMITAAVIALAVWGTAAARVDDEASQRMALIRDVYVILTAAMLAYGGAARRRRREQMTSLTEWPGPDPAQMHSPSLANMVAHCASVMESPRLLVVWEDSRSRSSMSSSGKPANTSTLAK
jgi:hypothetical protein